MAPILCLILPVQRYFLCREMWRKMLDGVGEYSIDFLIHSLILAQSSWPGPIGEWLWTGKLLELLPVVECWFYSPWTLPCSWAAAHSDHQVAANPSKVGMNSVGATHWQAVQVDGSHFINLITRPRVDSIKFWISLRILLDSTYRVGVGTAVLSITSLSPYIIMGRQKSYPPLPDIRG